MFKLIAIVASALIILPAVVSTKREWIYMIYSHLIIGDGITTYLAVSFGFIVYVYSVCLADGVSFAHFFS